jgi:hypothetical protein
MIYLSSVNKAMLPWVEKCLKRKVKEIPSSLSG